MREPIESYREPEMGRDSKLLERRRQLGLQLEKKRQLAREQLERVSGLRQQQVPLVLK
jgi:hypothetical protein